MVDRKRHLAKAVTYRFFGSLATAGLAYVATGNLAISASIGAADTFGKIGLYYLHERMWYRVKWGVHEGTPSQGSVTPTSAPAVTVEQEAKPSTRNALPVATANHAGPSQRQII